MVMCSNLIIPRAGGAVNYTGFSAWERAENPFVMPVHRLFVGMISPARYYYSIKKRRGPLRGPQIAPRWVPVVGTFLSLPLVLAGGLLFWVGFCLGGWGSVTPRAAGGAGAQPRYTPRNARKAGGLRSKHPPSAALADAHAAALGG